MSKYMTKQGDMWDQIAYNELGSTSHTDALMNANQQYKDIYIGHILITLNGKMVINQDLAWFIVTMTTIAKEL